MDKKITVSMLLDFYGQLLSEKQLEIMNYYYNEDLSLREIADLVGITRQGVYDTIKRSDTFLEELEQKLGLYRKWKTMEKDLECIESMLKTATQKKNDSKPDFLYECCDNAVKMIEDIKNKF